MFKYQSTKNPEGINIRVIAATHINGPNGMYSFKDFLFAIINPTHITALKTNARSVNTSISLIPNMKPNPSINLISPNPIPSCLYIRRDIRARSKNIPPPIKPPKIWFIAKLVWADINRYTMYITPILAINKFSLSGII